MTENASIDAFYGFSDGRKRTRPAAFYPMKNYQVTTKTGKQITADFTAVFKELTPAQAPKPVTQEERLAPYRSQILKQRERGFTWKQIADAMADPRINEDVTDKTLRQLFGKTPATTSVAASPSAQPAPSPARQRLFIDPATGQRISSPPAA